MNTNNIENKAHFTHLRNVGKGKKENYTIAFQFRGEDVHVGVAKCSRRDQFNKKRGRVIAEGRLERAMEGSETDWSFTLHSFSAAPKREIIHTVAAIYGVHKDLDRIYKERSEDKVVDAALALVGVMLEGDEPVVLERAGD